jgi:predicted O-linked N-acetylglucosamine transferase (SPINDLY family)
MKHDKKMQAQALLKAGRLQEAMAVYKEICSADKRDADAWYLLGAINGQLGNPSEAEACFRHAVALRPGNAQAHYNLAIALRDQARLHEAAESFNQAIHLKPDFLEAYSSLGFVMIGLGNGKKAAMAFRNVLRIRPDAAEAHINLANALYIAGTLEEAVASLRKAIAITPGNSSLHDTLGVVLCCQGKIDESIECHTHALRLKPDNAEARSNLLLILHYKPDIEPATLFTEHRRWAEIHCRPDSLQPLHANTPDPDRRLRVGYVSPDFRNHSVAFFIEPVLAHHDRAAFEITCYSTGERQDSTTKRLQTLASRWRQITGATDGQLYDLIKTDGIDVLVDLSGHTTGNRLQVFALKPAPIQITYLGYPDTTGLPTMDYRLTDAWADPPGESDKLNTENLVRLPGGFLCYQPPADAPPVTPPPCQEKGYITFGSFSNLSKTNPGVIALWARLLLTVPDARLILKYHWLSDDTTRERYYSQFAEHGVMRERVELLKMAPTTAEHLGLYSRMDVALDTFPYNGTTTTCEALWMGVPVVTLTGNRHSGRVGTSLLSQVGLSDCIAGTADDYIACAVRLASDKKKLIELRGTLRHKMAASSLCDGRRFTRNLEEAYRTMWRAWCNR